MSFPLGFQEIQLVPDGTLVLHVLIILIMVYVLNATLYKPINRILEARDKRTKGRLSEAQTILGTVSEKVSEYETQLRKARGEAYAYTEAQRGTAMQERQQKLAEMREQLMQSISREKEAIQRQAEEARAALDVESRSMAREIGRRVLNRSLSDAEMN